MPAADLRRLLGVAIAAEGVKNSTDLTVAQRSAGANMSVDIAAGEAYIADDHVSSNAGGFYWTKNEGIVNTTITTADATNPRVDRVILEVLDAYLGDASNTRRFRVVAGTPTGGATLTNLSGAAAVPSNAILLANVLVGAGVTSITTANIDTAARAVRPILELAGQAWTRLDEKSLGADGVIDFTNIPAGYTHLEISAYLRSDRAATNDEVGVWLNGDTTDANYTTYKLYGNTAAAVVAVAANDAKMGWVAGNTANASEFSGTRFSLEGYRAAIWKPLTASWYATTFAQKGSGDTVWKNTAAVTRIQIVPRGGGTNWKSGSLATLYGLR
jgi:hypothetical protein